jgi:phosphotransferase system enzyme I (PtsP)
MSAQAKLNKVVQIVAEAMASEVCSIYLLRDGVLELYATVGLNQSAVHVTKLAHGEGLVGTIARDVSILNLAEAASHPEFAYRPETGEELFHRGAGWRSSPPTRAPMTIWRSRRCRLSRWCCRS